MTKVGEPLSSPIVSEGTNIMSYSVTRANGALAQMAASKPELSDLVRPILEGSFGADWQRRSKIVYALKAAWQVSGNAGEEALIERLNKELEQGNSDYRVRATSLHVAELTARVMEIRDIQIDQVVDRQSFVF